MTRVVKRNSNNKITPLSSSRSDLTQSLCPSTASQGVGGRQQDLFFSQGGGGYLSMCTSPDFSLIQRREVPEDLRDIKLAPVWQRVAAQMGIEVFYELMYYLDQFAPSEGDRKRVDLPSKKSLKKLQRNSLIRHCGERGLAIEEIARAVKNSGYEEITEDTIRKVLHRVE